MNPLVNAAHAITAPGRITITTAQPDAEHVQISISDTGCGMPEDCENLRRWHERVSARPSARA